jgi:hypothetical protein
MRRTPNSSKNGRKKIDLSLLLNISVTLDIIGWPDETP